MREVVAGWPSTRDLAGAVALDGCRRSHLRLVEGVDAEYIYLLRSDPRLNRFLNAPDTSVEEQRAWIARYKAKEARGDEFYFVIVSEGRDRGVVRMYDFREIEGVPSFCWGSWIIAPPPVTGLATYSALMIYELGFDQLGYRRCHFDVRRENRKVIHFHQRAGATIVGEGVQDLFFQFTDRDYASFRTAHRHTIEAHADPWPVVSAQPAS